MNAQEPSVHRESSTYMTDQQAAQFCEVFAQGLETGLSYARILKFLERKGLGAKLVGDLRAALLEDGLRLSEAFARYGILDSSARKLIFVAEDQGTLPKVFTQQIEVYRERYERKKTILSSLAEPSLIFLLGVGFLLPIISNAFSILEASNKFFKALGYIAIPLIISLVLLSVVGALSYSWLKAPVDSGTRNVVGSIWMKLPLVSHANRLYAQSTMCRYLALSIQSGMNIFDSVALSIEASNDARLYAYSDRVLDAIERGDTLEDALSIVPILDETVLDYLGIGEETGRMSNMLLEASNLLKKQSDEIFANQMKAFVFFFRLVLIFSVLISAMVFGIFKELMPRLREALDVMGNQ